MGEIHVEIGATLPREAWLQARDDLAEAFPLFCKLLLRINGDGLGKEDCEEFLAEAQLAIQAMTYVAEFAADKCRFIVLPKPESGV